MQFAAAREALPNGPDWGDYDDAFRVELEDAPPGFLQQLRSSSHFGFDAADALARAALDDSDSDPDSSDHEHSDHEHSDHEHSDDECSESEHTAANKKVKRNGSSTDACLDGALLGSHSDDFNRADAESEQA